MDYRTFYLDLEYEVFNDIIEIVEEEKRSIDKYFIVHEQTNKEGKHKPHYHFLIYSSKTNFLSLLAHLKTIYKLVEKQKLVRKHNPRGGRALYGTPKKKEIVETYERFITYLCKEQDKQNPTYRTKGIDAATIQNCLMDSYKDKETVKQLDLNRLFKHLDNNQNIKEHNSVKDVYSKHTQLLTIQEIQDTIVWEMVEWIKNTDNQLVFMPTSIKSYFYKYLRTTQLIDSYTCCKILQGNIKL